MDKPSYYAILTADVRYCEELSSSQKLFFAEITALSQKSGKCWASNGYFAKLFGVARSTITSWVNDLRDHGFITVEYERNGKQFKKRIIRITESNRFEGGQLFEQGSQKTERGGQKIGGGWSENPNGKRCKSLPTNEALIANNTRENNTRYTPEFEKFWELYGKKKGKHKASLKWNRLNESEQKAVMENVPVFLTHYSSKQYTPYPEKYLNNRYWEDEEFQYSNDESNSNNQSLADTNKIRQYAINS